MTKGTEDKSIKKFESMLSPAQELLDNPPKIISVSPKLDVGLGGGITEGCLVILTGPEKVGKTVTALTIARNAQQTSIDEESTSKVRKVYYGNIEGRIKPRDIKGIRGLNLGIEYFEFVKSKQGQILSGEDYLTFFDYMVHNIPYSVGIVDSFSSLISKDEMINSLEDVEVAAIQRILSRFTKKISNTLPINKSVIIGITHLMANIKKFGAGREKTEKSGNALKYAQDVKLYATHKTPLKQGETQIGQTVHWVVENSALGKPGQQVESHIKYGVGIWNEYELAELAKEYGIAKGGTWLTLPNGDKVQGLVQFAEYLEENINAYNDIKQQVFEMSGISIGIISNETSSSSIS